MNSRTQHTGVLERLRGAAQCVGEARFMEVCGTHTVNAFRSGLHSLMPTNVRLLSGPGCPVCVTSTGDIDQIIQLAGEPRVIVCTYGDMLRVPGRRRTLERARTEDADVRIVYSAMDAVALAESHPQRQVVFAAVGFETTAPATAVAILQARRRGLDNFSVIASHKRIIPAMHALLRTETRLDGFLCPGHVAVIIGAEAFRPVVEQHGLSCVIGGFEGVEIAEALTRLCELRAAGAAALVNLYSSAVTPRGNRCAQRLLDEVFRPANACWRGLGDLAASGLEIREPFARFDARKVFGLSPPQNEDPPACRCGEVITGCCDPPECGLFASACTPLRPIGPCMVSSEGSCQAWFKYRRNSAAARAEVLQ